MRRSVSLLALAKPGVRGTRRATASKQRQHASVVVLCASLGNSRVCFSSKPAGRGFLAHCFFFEPREGAEGSELCRVSRRKAFSTGIILLGLASH